MACLDHLCRKKDNSLHNVKLNNGDQSARSENSTAVTACASNYAASHKAGE